MNLTDPVADMLTRIRNANIAMHDLTQMPSSKLKEALAVILLREGYIEGFEVADDPVRPGRKLTITMKYTPERKRTISGIKRVSISPQANMLGHVEAGKRMNGIVGKRHFQNAAGQAFKVVKIGFYRTDVHKFYFGHNAGHGQKPD